MLHHMFMNRLRKREKWDWLGLGKRKKRHKCERRHDDDWLHKIIEAAFIHFLRSRPANAA